MHRIFQTWRILAAGWVLLLSTVTWAETWEPIAPWVSQETVAVGSIALPESSTSDTFSQFLKFLQPHLEQALEEGSESAARLKKLETSLQSLDKQLVTIQQAGGKRLYFLLNAPTKQEKGPTVLVFLPLDLTKRDAVTQLQENVTKLFSKADGLADRALLTEVENGLLFFLRESPWETTEKTKEELEKAIRASIQTVPRPELQKGIQRTDGANIQICVSLKQANIAQGIAELDVPQEILPESLTAELRAETCAIHAIFPSKADADRATTWFREVFPQILRAKAQESEENNVAYLTDLSVLLAELATPTQAGETLSLDLCKQVFSFSTQRFGFLKQYVQYVRNQEKTAPFDAAADAKQLSAKLQPWMTVGTQGLIRVDFQRLKLIEAVAAVQNVLTTLLPETVAQWKQTEEFQKWEQALAYLERCRKAITAAGGKDVVLLVDPMSPMQVSILVPLKKNDAASVAAVRDALTDLPFLGTEEKAELAQYRVSGVHDGVLALWWSTIKVTNEQAFFESTLESISFTPREGLEAMLTWTCDAACQFTFLMTPPAEIYIKSTVDKMKNDKSTPFQLPSAKVLIRGVDFATLKFDFHKPTCGLEIYSKTEKAAKNFLRAYKKFMQNTAQQFAKEIPDPLIRTLLTNEIVFQYISNIQGLHQEGNRIFCNNRDLFDLLEGSHFSLNIDPSIALSVAVGIGLDILLPTVLQARHSAQQVQTRNKFRQIAFGMLCYMDTHNCLPAPYTVDENGKRLHSWRVYLLPYIEQNELAEKIRYDEPWDSEWNTQFHKIDIPVFQSAQRKLRPGEASIGVVVGDRTVFPAPKKPNDSNGISIAQITNGSSNTVSLVECPPVCWMDPYGDIPYKDVLRGFEQPQRGIQPFDDKTVLFGMCDGSVQTFPLDTFRKSPKKRMQLLHRSPVSPSRKNKKVSLEETTETVRP